MDTSNGTYSRVIIHSSLDKKSYLFNRRSHNCQKILLHVSKAGGQLGANTFRNQFFNVAPNFTASCSQVNVPAVESLKFLALFSHYLSELPFKACCGLMSNVFDSKR